MSDPKNKQEISGKIDAKSASAVADEAPRPESEASESQETALPPASGQISMYPNDDGQDFSEPEENEPYLGPAWAVVMLVLYLLKELFPAEQYSLFWFFQIYILILVVAITIFTLVKRYQFYKSEKSKK